MPWILGFPPETMARAPGAACAALVDEPHAATTSVGPDAGTWAWERPHRLVCTRSLRVFEREPPTIVAPGEGEAARAGAFGAARDSDRVRMHDRLERRTDAFTFNGEPTRLEKVAFDPARMDHLPAELKVLVETARQAGTLDQRPDLLQRDQQVVVEDGPARDASLPDLATAWAQATVEPGAAGPARRSTWEEAWRRGAVDEAAVAAACPLCRGGGPVCFRRTWIDATGLLDLERFLALMLEPTSQRADLGDVTARFPRKLAKGIKSQRTALAQRYFKGLKKFFHLMPVTEAEDAQALMATLFFEASPDLNAVSVETCDRWARELAPFVAGEARLREAFTGAFGEEEAEALLDQVDVLRALLPFLATAKAIDRPLPLVFRAV